MIENNVTQDGYHPSLPVLLTLDIKNGTSTKACLVLSCSILFCPCDHGTMISVLCTAQPNVLSRLIDSRDVQFGAWLY